MGWVAWGLGTQALAKADWAAILDHCLQLAVSLDKSSSLSLGSFTLQCVWGGGGEVE